MDINTLLQYCRDKNASDLHITVGVPPIARIHGELVQTDFPVLTPPMTETLVKQMMNEKQTQYLEKNLEVDFSYSTEQLGRFRVNAYKQKGSYATVIRLISTKVPNPEDLNLPASIRDLYLRKRGLILVTGPTGSGKSTTLAAIIAQVNQNRKCHVLTLEDPIEYLHTHNKSIINQREVGMDTYGFAPALRSALRQDPDVILVGEMRDLETIQIAITAAETGHLVLSTLHTNGAASTIERVIDVFPPHQQLQIKVQLANVLQAVVSQQLLPKSDKKGRVAAFEILLVNPATRNLIREGKTHQIASVMQTNKRAGMKTMDDSLAELYKNGAITYEEAVQHAFDANILKILL